MKKKDLVLIAGGTLVVAFISFKLGVHLGYLKSALIIKEVANERRVRYGKCRTLD